MASAEVYWQVVEFDDGLKHGKVSTIPGDTPFYTTDSNPLTPSDLSCLGNMTGGQTCQVTWAVNATGEVGTTHEFFIEFDPIKYISEVISETTSSVYLTITDASDVPPTVFLISPADNLQTNNVTQELKCEATDNLGLVCRF